MIPKDQMRAWQAVAWYDWSTGQGIRKHPSVAKWIGVYAIWHQARLLYIGSSKNVHSRLRTHFLAWCSSVPLFPTHATAFECESEQAAAALESLLIRAHRPIRNLRIEPIGGQVRKRAARIGAK